MSELIGLAAVICVVPLAYLFWQFARIYKPIADEMEIETTYVIAAMKKSAKKHEIDLDKEMTKTSVFRDLVKKRNFRGEMRREIMNDLFGKEKTDE